MTDIDALYSEMKPLTELVATSLFDLSEELLRKNGNFLPHGAALTTQNEVVLVAAAPASGKGRASSVEILPVLHDGLRSEAMQRELSAIGVAENVTVTPAGQPATQAIKVLVEHKRGLVVALYLPFKKQFLRGYSFGQVFSVLAEGEVNAWPPVSASPAL